MIIRAVELETPSPEILLKLKKYSSFTIVFIYYLLKGINMFFKVLSELNVFFFNEQNLKNSIEKMLNLNTQK